MMKSKLHNNSFNMNIELLFIHNFILDFRKSKFGSRLVNRDLLLKSGLSPLSHSSQEFPPSPFPKSFCQTSENIPISSPNSKRQFYFSFEVLSYTDLNRSQYNVSEGSFVSILTISIVILLFSHPVCRAEWGFEGGLGYFLMQFCGEQIAYKSVSFIYLIS